MRVIQWDDIRARGKNSGRAAAFAPPAALSIFSGRPEATGRRGQNGDDFAARGTPRAYRHLTFGSGTPGRQAALK